MEAIKNKWFWGIFISILSIFAMSHNANAIQPVLNLNNYDLVFQSNLQILNCEFVNMRDTVSSGASYCKGTVNNNANLSALNYIYSTNQYDTKKDDILVFHLLVSMDSGTTQSDLKLENLSTQALGWNVLDWRVIDSGLIKDNLYSYNGYLNEQGINYDLNVDFYEGYQYYRLYEISLVSRSDGKKNFGITSQTASNPIFTIDINDAYGATFRFRISDFKQYRFTGDEANKEVEQKTQGAVDDSQAAGGDSSTDAQSGTTGLINAITGAVSVISSAQATNCKINGNMGNLDIGELDLCANPAPAFIQTIGSLIMILICVPLAISLFNRFIAIFRSFQS